MFSDKIVTKETLHEHFLQLKEALSLERKEDEQNHLFKTSSLSLSELKADGYCRYPLRIRETGYGTGEYPYLIAEHHPVEGAVNRFSAGQPAVLFSAGEKERRELSCTINFVGIDRIKLVFTADELPEWVDEGKLGVMPGTDVRTYKECLHALDKVMNALPNESLGRLRDVIYGLKKPSFAAVTDDMRDHTLNESQNLALQKILTANDVAVVHGPPGTGKTTIIIAALKKLCVTEHPVLVSAPSNAAADLLTKNCIAAGLKPVRIGNLAKIDDTLVSVTPDELIREDSTYKEIKNCRKRADEYRRMAMQYKRSFGHEERMQRNLLLKEAKNLSTEAVKIEEYLIEKVLNEADVLVTTPVGAAHSWLRKIRFNTVFVDECAQATEPLAWIPVLNAGRVILAGDHMQLPPTVLSDKAKKLGLECSLLEQAVKWVPEAVVLSTIQYRMHQKIMEFPSRQFYEGRLMAHASVANRALDDNPVQWLDTAGCGFEESRPNGSTSPVNVEEARTVMAALAEMAENMPESTRFSIISPYKRQTEYIIDLLKPLPLYSRTEVGTVDSFQGREADVVILSLTRSNAEGDIGFLSDLRRMNVAITRAKSKLLIVGDSATVCSHPFFASFYDYVDGQGGYRSAWEFM